LKSNIKEGEPDFMEPIKFALTEYGVESFDVYFLLVKDRATIRIEL